MCNIVYARIEGDVQRSWHQKQNKQTKWNIWKIAIKLSYAVVQIYNYLYNRNVAI